MKLLIVVAYTKKYECRWQIINEDGKVIKSYVNRKDVLKAFEEMKDEHKTQ